MEEPTARLAPAEAKEAEGGGQESSELLRETTEPVLIPVHTFCHRACMCRVCQLFSLFLLLVVGGGVIYAMASPLLGSAALAVGPSFIIMLVFYRRFQCSTTKLQAWYTFLEAILWMTVLFILIEFVDRWNAAFAGADTAMECEIDAERGGKVFVNTLSFVAHCFHSNASGGSPLAQMPDPFDGVDWDGLSCSNMPFGLANRSGVLPPAGTGPVLLSPLPPLLIIQIAMAAANLTNGTVCRAVEDYLPDALTPVLVRSLAFGGRTADTSTRAGLRSAYDELFGRSAEGQDGCPCEKQFREGAAPSYDFCSEAGRCNVSRASPCAMPGREAQCAPAAEGGSVTATFVFRRKTVLYAFIEAYFRAAFLEELLKYVAVRRILFKDRVVDCGGLVVYGLAAAAGFATAENIQYTLIHGVYVTFVRMILSIPLHCTTGMMIGIHLGYRKFLGRGKWCLDKFLLALAMPVLIHGTYDFILMLPVSVGVGQGVRLLISLSTMVLGIIICRCMWLRIDNVCVVHVKDLQRDGRVSKSTCCCWERDCCRVWCEQEDPVLKERLRQQAPADVGVPESSSDSEGRSESTRHLVVRFSKSLSRQLLPEAPTCQTAEDTCPDCGNAVRVHVLFPSDCPYCGHRFPDPAPPRP